MRLDNATVGLMGRIVASLGANSRISDREVPEVVLESKVDASSVRRLQVSLLPVDVVAVTHQRSVGKNDGVRTLQ